jgi:hypothetical protein
MTHRHLIADAATAATFITAGKAIFTLANTETEVHATYRVEAVKDEDNAFTVALFTGTENSDRGSYTDIGHIKDDVFTCTVRNELTVVRDLLGAAERANDTWLQGFCKNLIGRIANGSDLSDKQAAALGRNLTRFHIRRAASLSDDHAAKVAGFGWVKARTDAGKAFPEKVEFWTEGRCCTCGRRLTNPKSIDALEGPVCAGRRGTDLIGIVLPTITPDVDA